MAEQTAFESELAGLLVDALELDDIDAASIEPEAALFGDDPQGLGLDSIDALEIALAVSQRYGVELRSDDENKDTIFASLRALARHVDSERGN